MHACRDVPGFAVYFLAYSKFFRFNLATGASPFWSSFFAGAVSGALSWIVSTPFVSVTESINYRRVFRLQKGNNDIYMCCIDQVFTHSFRRATNHFRRTCWLNLRRWMSTSVHVPRGLSYWGPHHRDYSVRILCLWIQSFLGPDEVTCCITNSLHILTFYQPCCSDRVSSFVSNSFCWCNLRTTADRKIWYNRY